jgi:hypothetical protein
MGYLFTTNQYGSAIVSAVTYPFTMACWLWCAVNNSDNGIAVAAVDKTASKLYAAIWPFSDGKIYLLVNGPTAPSLGHSVAYAGATWLPVIAVCHSATDRDLYVGASTSNSVTDTGALTGITTALIGARWDGVPSGPEKFFEGRLAEVVLAQGEEWDAAQRAAYIAGTETHKISGVTPDLYTNLIHNPSAPNGYGNNFTLNNGPVLTDHPSVLTGQNKKRLTITGIHADVVGALATYLHTPDSGYNGPDTLTAYVEDALGNTDTETSALTVSDPPQAVETTGSASGLATVGGTGGATKGSIGEASALATVLANSEAFASAARDVRPRFGKDMRFGVGYRFGKSGASDPFYAQPNG